VRLVLLNGRTVIRQAQHAGLVNLTPAGQLPAGHGPCELFMGAKDGIQFLGWSANLQGNRVGARYRSRLAAWIKQTVGATTGTRPEVVPVKRQTQDADWDGFVPRGATVRSRGELAALLNDWVSRSTQPTIGDIGSYGGKAWIWIQLGERRAHLNSDTRRSAVRAYLDYARVHGNGADWHVIANQRGKLNKVLYGPPGADPSGWYCYLTEPYDQPGLI
jgi:hypothetical protein